MGNEIKVNVIIPVYNAEKYIKICLDSLINQTKKELEFILINDGSTDNSAIITETFCLEYQNFHLYHKENGGLSTVRNFGIEHAKGDYIIFPDSDDWVEANYLEKLFDNMNKSGADLSICGYYHSTVKSDKHFQKKIEQMLLSKEEAVLLLVKPIGFQGYAWNKLYNMKTITQNGLRFDEELKAVQDLHFAVRYFFLM